jgi:hypothetical protein
LLPIEHELIKKKQRIKGKIEVLIYAELESETKISKMMVIKSSTEISTNSSLAFRGP